MQKRISLLAVTVLSLGLPMLAQASLATRVEERLLAAFEVAQRRDSSFESNAENLDLEAWEARARQVTPGSGASARMARAATLAYFVRGWNNFMRVPQERKADQVNDFWTRIVLSEQERRELLNRPVEFKILHVTKKGPFIETTVQFWPDLTQNDPSARVGFRLRETANGLKINEMKTGYYSIVRTLQAGLAAYRGRPKALVNRLVETKMVSPARIGQYRQRVN